MTGVLQQLPAGAAVAVVRLRSLGDCVLTTPALHLLKRSRPDLRLAVVVEDRFAPVFSGNPDVDVILSPSVGALRGWRPELCINFHGGTRSTVLTSSCGARLRAGFAHFRYAGAYNVRIPTAQEILRLTRKVHTAEHLASAMFYIGVPPAEIPRARLFAAPLPSGADFSPQRASARSSYAVIHPVAATTEKTWSREGFLAVARHLASAHGLEPVFIAGPGEDLSGFMEFPTLAGAPLETTKSLLSGAAFFLGNDSGPAHIAAAFGVPVVVLFGPSDPVVWAPWQVESEVLVGSPSIEDIRVEEVIRAADRLRVAS